MAYCLINKSNYFYNPSQIENRIDKDKIAVVIKNNAYGHGIVEIAKLANEYGIKAIIQPGGSLRDQESIDMCNSKGISMIFTKKRHFLH